ncbi:peptide-methionine (S)-S-oxide reductase MsrA [Thioalkalivibrio sp. XN8]|uniref:peptide-methionine (S)-S-oxide reductase MsrA n=1 Tax=Thioalkalivibrio sp. XN8 TaxID=2712863 RepID=UPI0013EE12AA|nr:peptide-methionine (S)-S-oxide reductase MsrA [Thioalkalivibrio sp. XN8]
MRARWQAALALALAGLAAGAAANPAGESGPATGEKAVATFAGGCFWCMEPPYDALEGVLSTTSGYAGGTEEDPSYEQVARGLTSHAEVVQVVYDPARVSYEELLRVYWRNIDPLAVDRQFCDAGRQYRSAIYYHDEAQRAAAERSLQEVQARFDAPVATEIEPLADSFYPAEAYHQDYYQKNPLRYRFYRFNCGRDQRLAELWGEEAGGYNK